MEISRVYVRRIGDFLGNEKGVKGSWTRLGSQYISSGFFFFFFFSKMKIEVEADLREFQSLV